MIIERKVWKVDIHIILWFLLILSLYLDVFTTLYGISNSLTITEGNPLMQGFVEGGFWPLVIIKTVFILFTFGVCMLAIKISNDRNTALVVLIPVLIVSFLILIMNLYVLRMEGLI